MKQGEDVLTAFLQQTVVTLPNKQNISQSAFSVGILSKKSVISSSEKTMFFFSFQKWIIQSIKQSHTLNS